jgi:replication fork clamp-binding protein CrfC
LLSEIQDLARRLEQQLVAFERLHADELKRFQDQLATYQRLQNDELQMLRDELQQLKKESALLQAEQTARAAETPRLEVAPKQVELTITRRDLLTGKLPPLNQKRPV